MSQFYEALGALLANGGERLAGAPAPVVGDERQERERRQLALLLRRIGVVWPRVFDALAREDEVLEGAVAALRATLAAHDVDGGGPVPVGGDPLTRHRSLLAALEQAADAARSRAGEPWAEPALRGARRAMAEAAAVRGELVTLAMAVPRVPAPTNDQGALRP